MFKVSSLDKVKNQLQFKIFLEVQSPYLRDQKIPEMVGDKRKLTQ